MRIVVIDGQGGKLGSQLIGMIRQKYPETHIAAVGTNSTATAAMIKSGADQAATGENPTIVACRRADVIIGPIGIVIADALGGEITPQMAVAVGQADATRILIPVNRCENQIAGVANLSVAELLNDVLRRLDSILPPIREQTQI